MMSAIALWVFVGSFSGLATAGYLESAKDWPAQALVGAGIVSGLLAPVTVAVWLCVGLYLGAKWLPRVIAAAYRQVFPYKAELPKARVIK